MKKNTLQRILALVLTICMVMGIFVGTVSAAEERATVFTASATSSISVADNGHYPVEFQLMNPTTKAYTVTLHQTAGDAELNYRGTSANNAAVTVAAKTDVLVSGYLTFDKAKEQNKTDVTVEIRSGNTVLDTVTIDIIDGSVAGSNAMRALSFDFNGSVQDWTNGTLSSNTMKITSGETAVYNNKLELVSGHLYRLTFDAQGSSTSAKVVASVTDYNDNGTVLSVPKSLNGRSALTADVTTYEHRFVANTTDLAEYASSALGFKAIGGTVYIDNVVLVDCGAALGNQVENSGFENPLHSNGYSINSQWDTMVHLEAANAGYGWAPYEGKECLSAVRENDDAPRFRPWATYNTADEVTLTFWSKYIAKDTSGLPATLQAKVHIWEYDETETQINDKVIGTFDLTDTDWESCDVNYQKPADVTSYRFAIEIYSNVIWFRGTLFDHFSLRSTQAAADVTDEQIANADPITQIKPVPALPEMDAPLATKFYFGTVTPVHGSLNVNNAEVAYDKANGYEIALFTMNKPADLPANAKPTVTFNGVTTNYVDGMTYKAPVKMTSGTYVFNWTETSTQKINFSHAGTVLLVDSAETLAAAKGQGFPIKLTADVPVSGRFDASGMNCNGYKLVMSVDSVITGTTLKNVTAPYGYKAVMNAGAITAERIVEGKVFSAGRSLSLEGEIYINQYVAFNGFPDVDIAKNGGLLIWKNPVSEEEATIENAEIIKEGLIYTNDMYVQQTDGIAVKEYADELYLRAYIRGQYGDYYYSPLAEYSVQDYCESRLENSKNEDMKNLAVAMLHYGASAQLYFDYNTADLANANIEKKWPAYVWTDHLLTTPEKLYSDMKGTGDVKSIGKTLSLDDAIAVNYYFETTGNWDVAEAELLVWDGVIAKLTTDNVSYSNAMVADGDRWVGRSYEFAAKEMGKTIFACAKFTDTDGNVHYSDISAYSPEAYAEGRINNSSNPLMVDLAKKMVIYGEFAATYFGVSDSMVKPEPPAAQQPPVEDEEEEDKPAVDYPAINTPDDVPYGDYLVYDGNAQAHIMLPENATELEVYAAEELQLHTELVTGATLPINYVDPANRAFEAYAEPASVTATDKGYYNVGITLKNPTDAMMELTLRQKSDDVENEPKLTIRGDNGNDGKVTMDPYSQIVVYGQFTVEDAGNYGYSQVDVEILSGDTVIATAPVVFYGNASAVRNSGLEEGLTGWTGGVIDTKTVKNGSASLKIAAKGTAEADYAMKMATGQLYYLSFWARADYANAELRAVFADLDANGNALKTPMSLNTRVSVKRGEWTFCEFYFTANTTLDADYENSLMQLVNEGRGNIYIDDVTLLTTGVIPTNEKANGNCETYNAGNKRPFDGWYTYSSAYPVYDGNYAGKTGMGINTGEYLGWTLQPVANTSTTYAISFWAKAMKNNGTSIRWDFSHCIAGISGYYQTSQTVVLTDKWEHYVVTVDSPDIEAGTKYNGVWVNFMLNDNIIMDHVQFYDLAPAMELSAKVKNPEAAPETEMPQQPAIPVPTNNGLTLFLATADSYPALSRDFGEDLEWIGETDGFAVRQRGGTIYIFGTEPRGTLNGVYDFIEDNLGVIWFRANDTAYDFMETVKPVATDYREKSPFSVRGMHTCSPGENGTEHDDWNTNVMLSRNKLLTRTGETCNWDSWDKWRTIGIKPYFLGHNVSWWITDSPTYDPNETEYWNTDEDGNFLTVEQGATDPFFYNVNFYSDKTVQVTVDSIRDFLQWYPFLEEVMVGVNDNWNTRVLPWSELPFEYEPGKFVYPEDDNYDSTVYYTYINKIAREIAKTHPDVEIVAFAYVFAEPAPACEMEPNVQINFAPLKENLKEPYYTTKTDPNNKIYKNMLDWKEKTTNIVFYNYYTTSLAMNWFERPIAYRIQQDLQFYAENGFTGCTPEGTTDYGPDGSYNWAMNQMTYWILGKLMWNPYEDVDALKTYFCNKVYGAEAGPYMLEYYDYIQRAWDENDGIIHYTTMTSEYLDMFILNSGYVLEMEEALANAWKAAEGVYKDRMQYIKETFDGVVMASSNLKTEEASALYTTAGKDVVLATSDFTSDIWKDTQRLNNFYENSLLKPIDGAATYARLLWDEDYFYVAYEMYDDSIENIKYSVNMDAANSWWTGKSDDVETYITVDPTKESYYFFASNPADMNFRWRFENGYRRHVPGSDGWEFKTYFVNEEGTENDKWIVIQAISWDILGLAGDATKDTEVLAYFYRCFNNDEDVQLQIGWNGALVWSAKSLRPIELRTEPYVAPEDTEGPDVDVAPPDHYVPQD